MPAASLYGYRVVAALAALLLGAVLAPGRAAEPDRDVVAGPLGNKLDAHMAALAEQGFSGALLVAKDGRVAIAKGYGYADHAKQVPFTSATVFDIGSITKQFTGAAIAKLQMQGKLSPHDKLSKYYDVPPDKSEITLYQLLTHSAGLRDGFGDDYQVATRRWIEREVLESKLLYPPGTRHRYSNAGYSILAAIVEKVSGQPYETYLREQLLLPAGLHHTGYRLPDWSLVTVAHGYRPGGQDDGTPLDHRWADDGPYWNLRGNGGILSTVWDMYRWHQALLGDELLSADIKKQMFDRRVQEGYVLKSWYGYGWSLRDTKRGTRVIEHDGGNGIFFANFARFVDDDVVIIVASNRSEDSRGNYIRDIARVVFP